MASLQFHFCIHVLSQKPRHPRCRISLSPYWTPSSFTKEVGAHSFQKSFRSRNGSRSLRCLAETKTKDVADEQGEEEEEEEEERPPFDLNLAVILAGFAFEAYTTPAENIGRLEVDAAGCTTAYLSESFVREIYDGQLFLKLKRGFNFPALDPWGTSDPYVVMELDGQSAKSKIKWGTKEPTWNEDFIFNIKECQEKILQVAAWDANLVTPHKRMGNAGFRLEGLCDGNLHDVLVELEGIGGGGKVELKVRYKSFEEIEEEKKWWRIPFIYEFLRRKEFQPVLKKLVGSEAVPARQFVEYAFGQLKSLNDTSFVNIKLLSNNKDKTEGVEKSEDFVLPSHMHSDVTISAVEMSKESTSTEESRSVKFHESTDGHGDGSTSELVGQIDETMQTDKDFWSSFADVINQSIVQKFGLPSTEKFKWEGLDILNKIGQQSQKIAEIVYVESGLATPSDEDVVDDKASGQPTSSPIQSSLPDLKKATRVLLLQTDSVLGALMVLKAAVPQFNMDKLFTGKDKNRTGSTSTIEDGVTGSFKSEKLSGLMNGTALDENKAEERKALFSTAESAMEAWAMLATSLGHPSFIRSEFEKVSFLDNEETDTQVAFWRDSVRKRLVIAFRGTEQTRWKDLWTDLMLVPAGLNPERIGGDFKQEVQVHSGFLSAYDSVRTRIISLLKLAIGYVDNVAEPPYKWHVYVTGHSLGGALATLLALELASSQLARLGTITVTMYNFGSPRVGNKKFAEVYNQKLKDSWRVVNHRDIIPTVPRLMGYCHENMELQKDGYQGDVIGEATPDLIVSEFMKGEKELIEKILQTEINIFRAIRDGSALMQHMEDFYYITLLESVRSYYKTVERLQSDEKAAVESFREA